MARTQETFGKLDILFVNAGVADARTLAETDEAFFDLLMDTNFKGAYFTIQKALPLLNSQASIILNGSINALVGMAGSSVYAASKAALHSLARTLSAELIGRGIRVNTITTGPTDTPIMKRADYPPEVIQAHKESLASLADQTSGPPRGSGKGRALPCLLGLLLRRRSGDRCRWWNHSQYHAITNK